MANNNVNWQFTANNGKVMNTGITLTNDLQQWPTSVNTQQPVNIKNNTNNPKNNRPKSDKEKLNFKMQQEKFKQASQTNEIGFSNFLNKNIDTLDLTLVQETNSRKIAPNSTNNIYNNINHQNVESVSNNAHIPPQNADINTSPTNNIPLWMENKGNIPTTYQTVITRCLATDYSDFLDTQKLTSLFCTSGLSKEILKNIWRIANRTFPGRLSVSETYTAIGLIYLAQNGCNISLEELLQLSFIPVPIFNTPNLTSGSPQLNTILQTKGVIDASTSSNHLHAPKPNIAIDTKQVANNIQIENSFNFLSNINNNSNNNNNNCNNNNNNNKNSNNNINNNKNNLIDDTTEFGELVGSTLPMFNTSNITPIDVNALQNMTPHVLSTPSEDFGNFHTATATNNYLPDSTSSIDGSSDCKIATSGTNITMNGLLNAEHGTQFTNSVLIDTTSQPNSRNTLQDLISENDIANPISDDKYSAFRCLDFNEAEEDLATPVPQNSVNLVDNDVIESEISDKFSFLRKLDSSRNDPLKDQMITYNNNNNNNITTTTTTTTNNNSNNNNNNNNNNSAFLSQQNTGFSINNFATIDTFTPFPPPDFTSPEKSTILNSDLSQLSDINFQHPTSSKPAKSSHLPKKEVNLFDMFASTLQDINSISIDSYKSSHQIAKSTTKNDTHIPVPDNSYAKTHPPTSNSIKFHPKQTQEFEYGEFTGAFQYSETNKNSITQESVKRTPSYNLDQEDPTLEKTDTWNKCLTACLTFITISLSHIKNATSTSVIKELCQHETSKQFFLATYEVYQISQRISNYIPSEWEELIKLSESITTQWDNVQGYLVQGKMVFPETENNPSNMKTVNCGVCLNAIKSSDRKLNLTGFDYHSTCANFWVNKVTSILPRLAK